MRLTTLIITFALTGSLHAGNPVLELRVGETSYVGAAVAHNDYVCWLAHADGRLSMLEVPDVTSFRRVGEEFEPMTPIQARNELRRQLGPGWEVDGSGHYLVATTNDRGTEYVRRFEELAHSFRSYFSRRGFDLPEPEFPLVAVVYADEAGFVEQCDKDETEYVPGLRGYYHRRTNRINLHEQNSDTVQLDRSTGDVLISGRPDTHGADAVDASIEAGFQDTIVHEATHQLAFNLGLHSRIGDPPRWVVEGLATMFEAEGTRRNTGGSASKRINRERFVWFNEYRRERRQPGTLAEFVSAEGMTATDVLDFYAESWALTFFLAETRPREYARYLKLVAERDPLKLYTSQQRLTDFQFCFGEDLSRLEVDMLRFIEGLK